MLILQNIQKSFTGTVVVKESVASGCQARRAAHSNRNVLKYVRIASTE